MDIKKNSNLFTLRFKFTEFRADAFSLKLCFICILVVTYKFCYSLLHVDLNCQGDSRTGFPSLIIPYKEGKLVGRIGFKMM